MREEAVKYYREMGRIASTITEDRTLRDDLIQEGALSLLEAPLGNTQSWYLQRAKRAMLNYLNGGVSVDSKKRENIEMTATHNREGEEIDIAYNSENARERMIYLELKARIEKLLTAEELRILELKERGYNQKSITELFNISRFAIRRREISIRKKLAFIKP